MRCSGSTSVRKAKSANSKPGATVQPTSAYSPHGRAACHYCGQCNRGCTMNANFTSPNVLIYPAMKTGKLTLITNAMAREITTLGLEAAWMNARCFLS